MTEKDLDGYFKEADKMVEQEAKEDYPKEHKYKSKIVGQITHFFDKRPNTLQIEQEEPFADEKGYPKDGVVKIRLRKDDSNVAFNLNSGEALEVAELLGQIARENLMITKALWLRKSK